MISIVLNSIRNLSGIQQELYNSEARNRCALAKKWACLQHVADVLKNAVEKRGKAYRFGGDEFVLLIQNGEENTITSIAETIKKELQQLHIEDKDSGRQAAVTISQGYASFLPSRQESRNSLIEHADKALYEVKENGRDGFRIIVE